MHMMKDQFVRRGQLNHDIQRQNVLQNRCVLAAALCRVNTHSMAFLREK